MHQLFDAKRVQLFDSHDRNVVNFPFLASFQEVVVNLARTHQKSAAIGQRQIFVGEYFLESTIGEVT